MELADPEYWLNYSKEASDSDCARQVFHSLSSTTYTQHTHCTQQWETKNKIKIIVVKKKEYKSLEKVSSFL